MTDDMPRHPTDDEVLGDAVETQLENEAEALVEVLLRWDRVVAVEDPELITALDRNAAAYQEQRETWSADMACGDLPPDDRALERIQGIRAEGHRQMVTLFVDHGAGPRALDAEVTRLGVAVRELHRLLNRIEDDDLRGGLCEHVAQELGVVGTRYLLGF